MNKKLLIAALVSSVAIVVAFFGLTGTLTIDVAPQNAVVTLNDKSLRGSPPYQKRLLFGEYRVSGELEGFAPAFVNVSVRPFGSHKVFLELQNDHAEQPLTPAEKAREDLIADLPISEPRWDVAFHHDYGTGRDVLTVALKSGSRESFLQWLRDRGIDPAVFEIRFP